MGLRDGLALPLGPFAAFHPAVAFSYLAGAIALCMGAFHPVYALLSLAGALGCSLVSRGPRATLASLGWAAPPFCAITLANPLFTSSGSTLLLHIGPRAVYLEALQYGACAGCVFSAMLLWFSCYAACMDSESSLVVLGRLHPMVALMVSQVMRLVPQLVSRGRHVRELMACSSPAAPRGFRARSRDYLRSVSVLMGWAMEDGLLRSEAMRARGFGARLRRSAYRRCRIRSRDLAMLAVLAVLVLANGALAAVACAQHDFYPQASRLVFWWGYLPYLAFLLIPSVLGLREHLTWR